MRRRAGATLLEDERHEHSDTERRRAVNVGRTNVLFWNTGCQRVCERRGLSNGVSLRAEQMRIHSAMRRLNKIIKRCRGRQAACFSLTPRGGRRRYSKRSPGDTWWAFSGIS